MGDQGVRLLENLLSYGGKVVMLTITAPGADRLPFDRSICGHPAGHKCSGPQGCKVNETARRHFNESAMRNWSALWNRVRVQVYREHGPGALRLLAYAPEPQQRGVLHFHLILGAATAREYAALVRAAQLLKLNAGGYGWGFVDTRPVHGQLHEAVQAAVYVAKYLTHHEKSNGLRALVVNGEAPRRAVYVAATLTKNTRCTMRNLRSRRFAYMETGRQLSCADAELWRARRAWSVLFGESMRGGARFALGLVVDADVP
jgi:hypothetical protein